MSTNRNSDSNSSDSPFTNLARSLECDEDEARWHDRLRRIAQHKPKDETVAQEPERRET